ncbi:MAG TPA: serine/threonine-protein kinase [Polyangiaceae bacterium]
MEAQILEPGTLVDRRYTIRRFIASGGIAHVYAATHQITGRDVALKMPRSDREREVTVQERLVREGQSLARARHPGVVELVDAGDHGGAPYLALELLEGRTLGGFLAARGKLGWEEVAYVGLKVADIVGHCHDRGVIHRDIKPDNLFALPSGTWNVKLFDFGIARLDAESPGAPNKLTQEGSILGTPEYMAPEALQMDAVQDRRVDIYSLGVMLFELLTGGVPFEGRYAEVLVQVSTKPLPDVSKLRADAPPALSALVTRCLAKDPAGRYQTMAEVSRDLRVVLGRVESVPLAVPTPADRPRDGTEKRTIADTPASLQSAGRAAAPPPAPAAAPPGKRRFPRAPYTTPAELKLTTGESISGRVEEISEGGLQFIAARGVKSGERGEFRFAEPITGKVLKVSGVSRWTKEARAARHATGFEFENAPEDSRQTIRKYVELMGGS